MNEQWTNLKGRYRAGRAAKKKSTLEQPQHGFFQSCWMPNPPCYWCQMSEWVHFIWAGVEIGGTFDRRQLCSPSPASLPSCCSPEVKTSWYRQDDKWQVDDGDNKPPRNDCNVVDTHLILPHPVLVVPSKPSKCLISEDNWKMKNSGQLLRSCWYRCWCVIARVQNDGDGKSKNKNPKESCSATENLRWFWWKHFDGCWSCFGWG